MAALAQLAGTQDTLLPNSTLAGTAPTQGYNFNTQGFQNAIKGSQTAFQNSLTTAPPVAGINYNPNAPTTDLNTATGYAGVTMNANSLAGQQQQLQQALQFWQNPANAMSLGGLGSFFNQSAPHSIQTIQNALNQVNAQIYKLQTAAGGTNSASIAPNQNPIGPI